MAIIQSEIAKGTIAVPQAFTSGAVVAHLATIELPAGVDVASGDIVELSVLPANHRVVDAVVIADGFTTETADIGLMSGDVGSTDDTRTSDDSIFAAADLSGFDRLAKGDSVVAEAVDYDRSIGLVFSAAVTGAGQSVTVQFLLTQ